MTSFRKKICLLGDYSVGKTSLIRRFVHNRFDDKYISTIGVNVSRKTVSVSPAGNVVEVTMMIWDMAGGEEFSQMQGSYLRGADGAILVCDLTRAHTLEQLETHAHNFLRINPASKLVIVANKKDLVNQVLLTGDQLDTLAVAFDTRYFRTSAKTGDEVESAFRFLAQLLV
ncbi:MAG: GTP-binding protein [Anaerolineaceae bacterium]|nr:GTP-binding protein [Anaerolineaceae bacterium]MCB9102515.1 GTP-binding protein [Anaerolineales bacterium]